MIEVRSQANSVRTPRYYDKSPDHVMHHLILIILSIADDPCPSPRRKSIVPRSSTMIQGATASSLDAEMAKALKVFFRDVKDVQNKLGTIKKTGTFILNHL